MSPKQALSILDQVASLAPLNRQSHAHAVEALRVLQDAIEPSPKNTKATDIKKNPKKA